MLPTIEQAASLSGLLAHATRVADEVHYAALHMRVHWNVMGHIGQVQPEIDALLELLRERRRWRTI